MLLQELVEQDFGIEGRGKWYHSTDHDSLVVNAEDQTWFWNSKGLRGNIYDYLIQIRGMNKEQANNFLKNYIGGLSEFKENKSTCSPYEKLVETFWKNGLNHREYWYKRCLTDDTIDKRQLGYFNGWSTIPIYDEDGEFVNFQIRRDAPEKKITKYYRDRKLTLYNGFILKYVTKVFITEGTVDAILLSQNGLDAVSPNGSNTFQMDWFPLFLGVKDIIYLADNDEAGMVGARKAASILGLERVKIVPFSDKPAKFDSVDFFRETNSKNAFLEYVNVTAKYLYEIESVVKERSR